MAAREPGQCHYQDLASFGVTLALSPTSTYPRLDSVSSSLKLSAIAMDRAIKGSFFCTEPRIWERSDDTTVPDHTVVILTTGHLGCQSSQGFRKEHRQQGLWRVIQCKDTVSLSGVSQISDGW